MTVRHAILVETAPRERTGTVAPSPAMTSPATRPVGGDRTPTPGVEIPKGAPRSACAGTQIPRYTNFAYLQQERRRVTASESAIAPRVVKAAAAPKVTMRKALSDPALLGGVLAGDSWRAWRILLIAAMGEGLDDEERAIFQKLTGRAEESGERLEELWAVIGRRGGKSRAIAVLIVFVAVFVDHSAVLVVGERPVVLCLAPSQKQAGVVLGYVAGIFESTPMLAKLVKNKTAEILSLTNGIEIEIRAASFRNVRGVTAVAVVGDEAAFWFDDSSGSSNPDTAILDALRPALATTDGLLAVISSPHARRGAVYETWARHYGEKGDKRILVAQGGSRDFNPSLPQKVVDRAMERDPGAASAEYLGLFRSDLEQFISHEAVRACVMPGVFEIAPRHGFSYIAFVDPSGGSADAMTLAIAYCDRSERAYLAAIREVRPPFSPEATVADFVELLRSYGVTRVRGDRYAGEWPRERFRALGVDYQPSDKSRSEIYGELLPLINSQRASLLDDKRLVSQLIGLERRTSRGGKDSIDHAPGGHDDLANATAGAVVYAVARDRRPRFVFG
jgi:hypothetical protein